MRLQNFTPEQQRQIQSAIEAFAPSGGGSQVNRRAIRRLQAKTRAIVAERVADTVQELESLGFAHGIREGMAARIRPTGNVWTAVIVNDTTSTWRPGMGFWNSRDFGAIGDFSQDDHPFLTDWLASMDAHRAAFGGGATGLLDAGDYLIGSTLTIGGETKIIGMGRLVSRIRGTLNAPLLFAQNVTQVSISSLGVVNGSEGNAGGVGIELDNVSQALISEIDVRQVETGIRIGNGSENCRAYNVWGTAFRDGIEISGSSNGSHLYGCRINNASRHCYRIIEVSQCNLYGCEAEGIEAGTIGYFVDVGGGDAIANSFWGCRAESAVAAGTGFNIQPGVQYTGVVLPYWTNVGTPIVSTPASTFVVNRGRFSGGAVISENLFQGVGEIAMQIGFINGTPNLWTVIPVDNDGNPTTDETLEQKPTVTKTCGSSNGVTAATEHFLSWIDATGSSSINSARAQAGAPRDGRIVRATVFSNGNLGSTTLALHVNGGAAVASDTQTLGGGTSATFDLNPGFGNTSFSAGDIITMGFTPANTVSNPVVVVDLEIEYTR